MGMRRQWWTFVLRTHGSRLKRVFFVWLFVDDFLAMFVKGCFVQGQFRCNGQNQLSGPPCNISHLVGIHSCGGFPGVPKKPRIHYLATTSSASTSLARMESRWCLCFVVSVVAIMVLWVERFDRNISSLRLASFEFYVQKIEEAWSIYIYI